MKNNLPKILFEKTFGQAGYRVYSQNYLTDGLEPFIENIANKNQRDLFLENLKKHYEEE